MESASFPSACIYDIVNVMMDQDKKDIVKKRGRPATGLGTGVLVRIQPDMLDWVDAERAKLDPQPTRPEFIRQVLDRART